MILPALPKDTYYRLENPDAPVADSDGVCRKCDCLCDLNPDGSDNCPNANADDKEELQLCTVIRKHSFSSRDEIIKFMDSGDFENTVFTSFKDAQDKIRNIRMTAGCDIREGDLVIYKDRDSKTDTVMEVFKIFEFGISMDEISDDEDSRTNRIVLFDKHRGVMKLTDFARYNKDWIIMDSNANRQEENDELKGGEG